MASQIVITLLTTFLCTLHADYIVPRTVTTLFASSSFPIDPNYVVTTGPTIPAAHLSGTELGPCICDLTYATCDWNCSCDPDCTESDKNTFTFTLPEGPRRKNITRCVDPEVIAVNKRGAITVDVFTNLVCVTKDNSPSKGFFLDTPISFTSAELDAMKQQSSSIMAASSSSSSNNVNKAAVAVAFVPSHRRRTQTSSAITSAELHPNSQENVNAHTPMAVSITPTGATSTSASTFTSASPQPLADTSVTYQSGSSIPRAVGTTTLTAASPSFLPLPAPDLLGLCSDHAPAHALTPQQRTCPFSSRSADPATVCASGGALDAARLFKDTWVASVPGALLDDNTQWRSVVIARVDNIDNAVVTNTFTLTAGSSYSFPAPVWSAATCTCTGALQGAQYTIATDAGVITNVYVSLRTTTVTATSTGGVCGPLTVQQQWSSISVPAALVSNTGVVSAAPTADHPDVPVMVAADNTIVVNRKSGNPGYTGDQPVLAGTLTTLTDAVGGTVTAVKRSPAGLTALFTDAARTCLATTTTPSTDTWTHVIAAGRSARFSCQLSLTESELQALCSDPTGVQQYLSPSATVLGKWGNATYHNPSDWVTVESETFPTTIPGTWSASTRTCRNLVTSLHWDIFTADYGAVTNRQRAIVGAKTSWTRKDWVHTGAASQTFSLSLTVDYHHYPDGGVKEVSPRGPPVLPSLPEDFLYPFTLDNAVSATVPSMLVAVVVFVVAMIAM